MTVTDDSTVKDVGDLLREKGWTLTVRPVPGKRLRAVLLAEGAEVGSAVHEDFTRALQGAIASATNDTTWTRT